MSETGDSMNSQLKDALNDFINRNSAAIEQAMENTNHAKDEPLIQDLVNYLSGTKDSQTMSMDDGTSVQQNLSCESNLDLTQLINFKSPHSKSKSEGIPNSIGHVHGSGSETSFSSDTRLHLLMQELEHPQQFQQHHDSYGQSNSLFPYSVNQSSATDNISNVNLSSSTFDRPRDHHKNEIEVSTLLAAGETQYGHSDDSVHFQFATDTSRQYSSTQATQFSNTENGTGYYQNASQHSSNGFKDSSMLSSSFTSSASSEMSYSGTHDNRGYGLMDVIHASVNNMDLNNGQIKAPEKMQTDEPEVIFKQAATTKNGGHYHPAQMQTLDEHLQSYCSRGFNLFSALDSAHSSVPSNRSLSGCEFEQNLTDSAESHSSADSSRTSVGATHTSTTFGLNVNTCESSLSSPFTSQNFQESVAELTPLSVETSVTSFQGQPNPCQVNSVNSDTTVISQQSGSAGFSMSSSPSSGRFNPNSSHLSPYHSNQYQDSPTHSHSSLSMSDDLKICSTNSTSPLASLSPNHQLYHHSNFDPPSYQHPQSSHQSSTVSPDEYQQNLAAGSDFAGNPTVVRSMDQHVIPYQGNTAPSMNIVQFSESASTDHLNQQHLYVTSSSAQANESSFFMKCTSVTTEMAPLNQICSQNTTEHTRSDSHNQIQSLTDSNNSSSDVTMREIPVEGNIHSFSPRCLQTVVNNFGTIGRTSTDSQNNCSGTSSMIFSQPSNSVVGANSQLNLNDEGQSVETMASCMPSSSATTLASEMCGQHTVPQFGSSCLNLPSTSQVTDLHLASQVSMKSFPQPMQVQDSEYVNKMPASFARCSPAANDNTNLNNESSMDVSCDPGEYRDSVSHGISFEEIHMSIVNAGDRLAQELCGTNVEQTMLCKSTHSLVGKSEPAGCFSDVLSFRDLRNYHTEASKIDDTFCGNIASDDARLQSAMHISDSSSQHSLENVPPSGSFNNDTNTKYILTKSSSAPAELPNLNADHNLLASILNTQTPAVSNQLQLQDQMTNQTSVAVPNFLHGTMSVNMTSNKDHLSLMSSNDVAENHQQIHFVATTASATPFNSKTVFSSSDNQFSGASMVTDGAAQNLLQSLSSLSHSRAGLVDKTSRNGIRLHTNQDIPVVSMNLTEITSDLAPSSETSSQLTSSSTTSKTLSFSPTHKNTLVIEANTMQDSSDSLSGITSFGMSAAQSSARGSTNPGAADGSDTQPHIIVSLDDLQKLILQQKSHSSSPVLHQLSHGAAPSPQTLVLQKHASHSLRHSQPRSMVKAITLTSSSRVMNCHQQVLHSRDRTQLLGHKTEHSEHLSDTEATWRNSELAVVFTDQESKQKLNSNTFHIPLVSQKDQQQAQRKPMDKESQPKMQLQLKQTEIYQQQQASNNFLKETPKPKADKLASLQLGSQQQLVLSHSQQQTQGNQNCVQIEPGTQQNVSPLALMLEGLKPEGLKPEGLKLKPEGLKQERLKQLQKQENQHHQDGQQKRSCLLQFREHLQPMEQPERSDRLCTDSLKHEYKHLHSLLTGETAAVFCQSTSSKAKAPQSTDAKDSDVDMHSITSQSESVQTLNVLPVEDPSSTHGESHAAMDAASNRQTSLLAQILTERKRCHTPLSVGLHSPGNSNSEAGSPLPSPTFEDGNTQLTLIERSASLQIKSDHLISVDDGEDDENAIFDLNAFHKRPSVDELHSSREKNENVPMKVAKPSIDADAHTSIILPSSPEPKFDFGSAISSASHFSFAFGSKDRNSPGMFTFGSSGTALPTNDPQHNKDGSNHNRPSCSKPLAKAVGMRPAVPTQPVKPASRRQKEYSLKACYPSKVDATELKILAQPEPQHRARYQTEGSRGAIKDESQQGYPIIKLFGYSKATKLQVYIGDEGVRVKPHGFYQACRVTGKNSTPCEEQEIEGTTVLEVDMLPENNMTAKLDCIGILKLRNADVERRIGSKRARDKKRTNTRARLVIGCSIEKSDGRQYFLQVASNPIVCTQPVGQPEISRMSLSECSVQGGDSLFIIGKNFRNKGTSVLFQTLDSADDYVTWQAEAEIEQEYFQPTHLICKIPAYKDKTIKTPQEAQIVVSCAGKMSDPHSFIYKPVYHMASSVKQEFVMETDVSVAGRPLPFVSPEALQLNRMVQQTHAQSAITGLFQLPANTFPDMPTPVVKPPPATSTFKGLRPAMLTSLTPIKSEASNMPVSVTVESSPSASVLPVSPASVSVLPVSPASVSFASGPSKGSLAGTSHLTQPAAVFGEKYCNGLAQRSPGQHMMSLPVSGSTTNSAAVNNIAYRGLNTKLTSPLQPATGKSCPELSLVSAPGAALPSGDTDLTSAATTSFPSAPFFLVVDPAVFHSSTGGDKIQQLLLQILEAQSKLV